MEERPVSIQCSVALFNKIVALSNNRRTLLYLLHFVMKLSPFIIPVALFNKKAVALFNNRPSRFVIK